MLEKHFNLILENNIFWKQIFEKLFFFNYETKF